MIKIFWKWWSFILCILRMTGGKSPITGKRYTIKHAYLFARYANFKKGSGRIKDEYDRVLEYIVKYLHKSYWKQRNQ